MNINTIREKTVSVPFNVNKVPVYYGWIIVITGTIGVLMSVPGQTAGVSVYTDYLIQALGLSRAQLSTAYMIGTFSSSLILGWAGKMFDKLGARIMTVLSTLLLAITLVISSKSNVIANSVSELMGIEDTTIPSFVTILICFFFMRFSGQGVLTMTSRNMIMKWFEKRRGLVNAISGTAVALGFSAVPLLFDNLIKDMGWSNSWVFIAFILAVPYLFIVLLFNRDNPESCGMSLDGKKIKKSDNSISAVKKEYTLKEAKSTLAFWVYSLSLSMFSLMLTAFTFHIVSVFEKVNIDRETALKIFVPTAIISVAANVITSWLSDKYRLRYILLTMTIGGVLSSVGLIFLAKGIPYVLVFIGNGIIGGIFSCLNSVVWPKYYGRKHLGAISGSAMSMIVLFSAIGPWLFSVSEYFSGQYTYAYIFCLIIWSVLLLASFKVRNPQLK